MYLKGTLVLLGLLAQILLTQINPSTSNTKLTLKPQETIFKVWLRDTLPNFNRWKLKNEVGVYHKLIYVTSDSLLLKAETRYKFAVNNLNELDVKVQDKINLLTEYNEVPQAPFQISYTINEIYFPSTIRRLKFESSYEILNFIVEEKRKSTEFYFIRGRLSGKKVQVFESNGTKTLACFDFNWKGDTLTKMKRVCMP